MEIELPGIVAEVRADFERYEGVLGANDVVTFNSMFHKDLRVIRHGGTRILTVTIRLKASCCALASRTCAHDIKDRHQHLRLRPCRRLDTVSSRERARKGQPSDADLGSFSRRVARRRGTCEIHLRAKMIARGFD